MKKIIKIIYLLVIIIFITGCEAFPESKKEDRIGMTNEMKKLNIISKDFKQIDIETHCSWSMEWCACSNTYIFEDSNSNIIGIQYRKIEKSDKNHQVYIYDLKRNNDYHYLTEEELDCSSSGGYYTYNDNKATDETKYKVNDLKIYNVKEKVIIPFIKSKYVFSKL